MDDHEREYERHLYELWASRARTGSVFTCLGGERVTVVSAGRRNNGAGPDFLDAVLLVNGALMCGAVEMHWTEGEWMAHGHDHDPAYRTVILHLLGVPPKRPRLPIPTLDAGLLTSSDEEDERFGDTDAVSTELIAALAWERLLRRSIEIMRSEPEIPLRDRLARAFTRRLFDCLGYSRNRAPMREVAERMLVAGATPGETFDSIAAQLFGAAGLDGEAVREVGCRFMSDARLDAIVASSDSSAQSLQWRYDTRPTNAPARRLWGGAKLLLDLDRHRLLARLAGRLIATRSVEEIERALVVRMGGETLVGVERAREIVINALLPTMLAAGVESGRRDLIEAACVAYRTAPSPASNEIVRGVAARFFHGREPEGAFMQQGMIEFHQRYRSSDRRALSFIAERGPRDYYPARA